MRVLSIGEILWDVFPDRDLLGGAALNFSANITRLGDSAILLTAVGDDSHGRRALEAMRKIGLITEWVQVAQGYATGTAQVGLNESGEACFRIPRPAAFDHVTLTPELRNDILLNKPDWIYFGTLIQSEPRVEEMIRRLVHELPGTRCFYDINLRDGHWNLPLVERLSRLASVVKMNELEARTLAELSGQAQATFAFETFCKFWAQRFGIGTICITLGEAGCFVYSNDDVETWQGYPVVVDDTIGAGDAFAAAFLHGFHNSWPIARTAQFANAVGSIVASRAGATPDWSVEECYGIARLAAG